MVVAIIFVSFRGVSDRHALKSTPVDRWQEMTRARLHLLRRCFPVFAEVEAPPSRGLVIFLLDSNVSVRP